MKHRGLFPSCGPLVPRPQSPTTLQTTESALAARLRDTIGSSRRGERETLVSEYSEYSEYSMRTRDTLAAGDSGERRAASRRTAQTWGCLGLARAGREILRKAITGVAGQQMRREGVGVGRRQEEVAL